MTFLTLHPHSTQYNNAFSRLGFNFAAHSLDGVMVTQSECPQSVGKCREANKVRMRSDVMKASTYKTKLAMALCAVVSLSMVTTGCKTSSKKKAAVAAPSPPVIPPPQPAPPVDTSTNTSVAVPVGGVTCETLGILGASKKIIKIDVTTKRMSITDANGTAVYYTLTQGTGLGTQFSATVDPVGLNGVTPPTRTGSVRKLIGNSWYLSSMPFLTSKAGQAQTWEDIRIVDGCS
jgi:hypothetical protein